MTANHVEEVGLPFYLEVESFLSRSKEQPVEEPTNG